MDQVVAEVGDGVAGGSPIYEQPNTTAGTLVGVGGPAILLILPFILTVKLVLLLATRHTLKNHPNCGNSTFGQVGLYQQNNLI